MTFWSWQALGNVYLLSDDAEALDPDEVRRVVGDADGIVQVTRIGDTDAEVVIWNPDGSVAEMSGNGTRIAAAWLIARTGATQVTITTGGRRVAARVLGDGRIEQAMGPVRVVARERVAGLDVIAVDVGNPHAVVVGDPGDLPLIGPLLETHPRFPNRTNVQVARVDAPGLVAARVWERGVGETRSSGTSAVAVAAATHREGDVRVRFPGGELEVRLRGGEAWLTGPAERVQKRHEPGTDASHFPR